MFPERGGTIFRLAQGRALRQTLLSGDAILHLDARPSLVQLKNGSAEQLAGRGSSSPSTAPGGLRGADREHVGGS